MLLSTAIPIVIAAIVIVIISKGIPNKPIIPKIRNADNKKIKDLNVTAGKLATTLDISSNTVTLPASVGGLGTGITNAQLAGSIDVTSKITGVVPTWFILMVSMTGDGIAK